MKYLLSVLLLLSACARPDYLDPKTLSPDSHSSGEACPLTFTNTSMCASLSWTNGPWSPNESEFILKFWNQSSSEAGPFTDPANTLSVVLWMPSMGHGSSPVTIEKIETGVYRIRRVYFIMPGDWEVRLSLKDGSKVLDQVNVSLTL